MHLNKKEIQKWWKERSLRSAGIEETGFQVPLLYRFFHTDEENAAFERSEIQKLKQLLHDFFHRES